MKYKGKKYNSSDLLLSVPQNTVITSQYLRSVRVSDRMMFHYTNNMNLFESVGQGAFIRKGDKTNWMGGLYALQQEKEVHAGGLTSFNLLGLTHFIRFKGSIHLFSSEMTKLPKWMDYFKSTSYGEKLDIKLFNNSFLNSKEGMVDYSSEAFHIKISAPERAILEYLYLCPTKADLKEAYQIIESGINFKPKLLQTLLESSSSIKVNRLFLSFAEKINHKWFKYIDTSKIKLGTGKWTIVKGGKFDSKYKITIPKDIAEM